MTGVSPTQRTPAGRDAPAPIIAREGWVIIAAIAVGFALLAAGAWWVRAELGAAIGVVGLIVTAWAVWFFRDPARRVPLEAGAVISPADGVVVSVGQVKPPMELGFPDDIARGMTRVSIFMNIFNVHVNRAPMAGVISRVEYRPGKFFNASLDKASEFNERCGYRLELADGRAIAFVQIAGLVARRIVCKTKPGARVSAGERIGLIRFGSRVDVYLPPGVESAMKVGEKSVAGETILARVGAGVTAKQELEGKPGTECRAS